MWLDLHTKLAEIAAHPAATSATTATQAQAVRTGSHSVHAPQGQKPTSHVAEVASVATPVTSAAKSVALPTSSLNCATCGRTDWRVSMEDTDGRTLHVSCWRAEQGDIPTNSMTQTPPVSESSVTEIQSFAAKVASVATTSAAKPELEDRTAGGRVQTWTGRVVSLADWRNLTEWERHGPNGRYWCRITHQWEQPNRASNII